ncbi:MAG: hypothetical protein R3B40_25200 [Polyangiales bacterium]|nr:hypothetical protein [Myxococcales bacterium]MCB9661954.1 hypothetical protein [Sandaracinaceae bacterium]
MRHITCRCREVEPYDSTHDLERRIAPPREDARYATLERVDALTIRCRSCGRTWAGEPLVGGGVYGDTLWRSQEPPEP